LVLPLYIAKRYLISKKSHNIINIISLISVVGVTVGTMALIIVLSVFNGFEKLVLSLFNSFNPDLVISLNEGKTFRMDDIPAEEIRRIPGVLYLSETVEENALMKYRDKQYIVTLKGVSNDFSKMTPIDSMITEGKFVLEDGATDYAVLGYGVAYYLGTNLNDVLNPISVYVPRRESGFHGGFDQAFHSDIIFPSGYFSIQQDFDIKYVLLPLRFVRKLLNYNNEVTSVEIGLDKGADPDRIRNKLNSLLGERFRIKDRYQQQEFLYKIMKSEKWAIFMILAFILFIATFNIVGSLSMLILDKKKDIAILNSLGASKRLIKGIFLTEGMMISFTGAIAGLILGAVICLLQMQFGLIRLGSPGSTFVVDTYPVEMKVIDFVLVFITVIFIGFLAALYPVWNIRKIDTSIARAE
jgi:lipoprotein-releasing system permease protein